MGQVEAIIVGIQLARETIAHLTLSAQIAKENGGITAADLERVKQEARLSDDRVDELVARARRRIGG